jgi:alpha-1,3/alpha-1,6-mannosyltransferase
MPRCRCRSEVTKSRSSRLDMIRRDASTRLKTVWFPCPLSTRSMRSLWLTRKLINPAGTLKVHTLGSSLPRSLFNSLHILFAILRQLTLTLLLFLSLLPSTHLPFSLIPSFLRPIKHARQFDVFFVDQLSVCVPFVRWALGTRVVFYCHFPDKLLSGGWDLKSAEEGGPKRKEVGGWKDLIKGVYRLPIDLVEEFTTGT